jgi:hypothetical protein
MVFISAFPFEVESKSAFGSTWHHAFKIDDS